MEDEQFYPVIKAVLSKGERDSGDWEIEDRFGPVLIQRKHPILAAFLKREWANYLKVRDRLQQAGGAERTIIRLRELEEEMGYIKKAARLIGADDGMEG